MAVQNFAPRMRRQNENLIVKGQGTPGNRYGAGMHYDIPGSLVPPNGIHYSLGYIPFLKHLQPCAGCKEWSSTTLPILVGGSGMTFSKEGAVVTKSAGRDFAATDVGNYVVYADGETERIIEYISTTKVTVDSDTAHATGSGSIRGNPNGGYSFTAKKKLLLHIDTRLFISDAATMPSWLECYCISTKSLPNYPSIFYEHGDYVYIFCTNGIFMVDLSGSTVLYWQTNSPIPTIRITNVAETPLKPYGYKYLYSMTNLKAISDTVQRTDGYSVKQETGTCKMGSDAIDYGKVFAARPVGDGSTTYAVLTGAGLASPYNTSAGWALLSNAQFGITIDGTAHNVAVDMTLVKSMNEVADTIQAAMRAYNSSIKCVFSTMGSDDRFVITNPVESGTLGYVSAGNGGTDIGTSIMKCQSGTGTLTAPGYTAAITIGTLTIPADTDDSTLIQTHYNRFTVYRSKDIGENGIDPISGEGNNEEEFIFVADIPVAKAFTASRSGSTVTATEGTFSPSDVGCILSFQNGTDVTISAYTNSTQVTTSTSGSITSQSAAIGGTSATIRVMTISQSGTTITWFSGDKFVAGDVGKPVYFCGGQIAHITAVEDDGEYATAAEDLKIAPTAACMDPTARYFTDTLSDVYLQDRAMDYQAFNRFLEPLPLCDFGVIISGYIFAGIIEQKKIYYAELPSKKDYVLGQYNPAQFVRLKDNLQALSVFPDRIVAYCTSKTLWIPTTTLLTKVINSILSIKMVAAVHTADEENGICGPNAFSRLPGGYDIVVNGEHALKIFDGSKFGNNLAEDRVQTILTEMKRAITLQYDPLNGVSIYGYHSVEVTPEAGFSFNNDDLAVQYFSETIGTARTWSWTFYDESGDVLGTSTLRNPVYTYDVAKAGMTVSTKLIINSGDADENSITKDVGIVDCPDSIFDWEMDEGTGSTVADSKGTNNGTWKGTGTHWATVGGKTYGAFNITGDKDNHILGLGTIGLPGGHNARTLSVRFRRANDTDQRMYIAGYGGINEDNTPENYETFLSSYDYYEYRMIIDWWGETSADISEGFVLPHDTDEHVIVITQSGYTFKLYLDGVLKQTVTIPDNWFTDPDITPPETKNGYISCGSMGGLTNIQSNIYYDGDDPDGLGSPFEGYLRKMQVWDTALSLGEIEVGIAQGKI